MIYAINAALVFGGLCTVLTIAHVIGTCVEWTETAFQPLAEPETPRRYDDWLAEVEEIAAKAWRSWTYGH